MMKGEAQAARLRGGTVVIAWIAFGLYMAVQIVLSRLSRGMTLAWEGIFVSEFVRAPLDPPHAPRGLACREVQVRAPAQGQELCAAHRRQPRLSFAHRTVFITTFALYGAVVHGRPFAFDASDLVVYVDYGVLLYWMIWLIGVGVAYAGRLKEREAAGGGAEDHGSPGRRSMPSRARSSRTSSLIR